MIVIEGTNIRLRRWRLEDLEALTALRNDVSVQAQAMARARGSGPQQVNEWLLSRDSNESIRFYVVATADTDQAVGYLQFTGIDPIDRRAELGICLAANVQGGGYGGEAISLGLAHLNATEHLRKCTLQVREDNETAVRCYLRLGFVRCGMFRRHAFLEGEWRDVILMEWVHE